MTLLFLADHDRAWGSGLIVAVFLLLVAGYFGWAACAIAKREDYSRRVAARREES